MNASVKRRTAEEAGEDLTSPAYWDGVWKTSAPRGQLQSAPALRNAGQRRKFDAMLISFLDAVGREPADILELGCAPGSMLARMHALRPQHRYHGVDYAPQGVADTRRFLQEAGVAAQIHLADVREFAPPQKYDLVLSLGLVEHFPDPAAIFSAHRRLCKDGGVVAVSVPNYAPLLVKWFIEQVDPEALRVHCLEIMHPDAIHRWLSKAGLVDVSCGVSGNPTLRTACPHPTTVRRVLRTLGQGWNAMASVTPERLLWSSVIWGMGRCEGHSPPVSPRNTSPLIVH